MQNVLEIIDFSCGYPGKFIISGISFSVPGGSFVGIVGPNGSGKTTLFKGISAELNALSGKIVLTGKNTKLMGYKERARKMAIVSQNIETMDMKVEDYVLLGRLPYQKSFQFFETEKDYALAQHYIKLTGIEHLKDKYMDSLSGGEQQLAAIARALAQEPELLLLDEPTSHLDIGHQVQILNLIQSLNNNLALSVLMIIHDLNLAAEYCDFLVMLKEGSLHAAGTAEKVLDYRNIEEVYQTLVVTQKNPLSGKPAVFLVSGNVFAQKKDML
ncbi:MAG: ABC transporter ATP-binding protein [Bacteroidales bacterium]